MRKSIEERVAGFTIEFVKKVAGISEDLICDNYCMHCGKKKFMFADIAWDELTVEDCLGYMHEDHKLDVKQSAGGDDWVAHMVCEGDLYEKMHWYDAHQEDIYGDGDEAERLHDAVFRIAEKYNLWFDWHGDTLVFYDKVYSTINKLLNYEFNDGERRECPIVVLGPDGSKLTMLRIYAYGGLIGRIATGAGKTSLADKNYSKYLSEEYLSNDDEIDKSYLQCMNKKYVGLENGGLEYIESMVCSKLHTRLEEILDEPSDWCYPDCPEYLDLILKAVEKKFMNKGKELGERRIETAIVKQHMKKDAKWCVVDMEYTVPRELDPAGKGFTPDIVVFDSIRGFGFIELKYDNESTDNLPKHYDDVQNLISDEKAVKKVTNELKRRSSYLRNYGLIDDTLYKSMQNSHNLWQGFLFVGGKRENTVNLVKNHAEFSKNQDCRFAFYPYDEKHSAVCIDKIKLDYQSMQTYDNFIGMI